MATAMCSVPGGQPDEGFPVWMSSPNMQASQVCGHCNVAVYLKVEQLSNENLAISRVVQSQYE